MKTLIYLASPYTSGSPTREVIEQRFESACNVAKYLFQIGHLVFSPIAHTHPIFNKGGLPGNWEFYAEYDKRMMDACDELWVLALDGWKESVGCQAEIKYANETGKPVRYIDEDGDLIPDSDVS